MKQKIYHYTSIQTLALILKNKKIRFSRLDNVDDMEESMYGSGSMQSKLGRYTFVSCWTKSATENIALWNMYTNNRGVRIALDEMPFKTYDITNSNFISLFPNLIQQEHDYLIFANINEAKLHSIDYVDNIQEEINNLIQSDPENVYINNGRLGLIKRKEWSFQQEVRFRIIVSPVTPNATNVQKTNNPSSSLSNNMLTIGNCIATSKPVSCSFIDLDLDTEKLADIEVMMGPLTSEADKIIVESLLLSYPNAKIYNSVFLGKIREK